MKTKELTADRVREMLTYDPDTGIIRWGVAPGNGSVKVGDIAGHPGPRGYLQIRLDGASRIAHRLAWAIATGSFPKGDVDHINGIKSDNRLCNLRDVQKRDNQQNRIRPQRNNKSGFLGVSKRGRRWRATIKIDGRCIQIGVFDTPEEAHSAYLKEKRQHHAGNTL